MEVVKLLRLVQVLLVLGAVLTGLSWFEDASDPQHREVAEQTLTVQTRAPVETAKGPWEPGMTFTDDHAGVPLDVAPTMTIDAQHASRGLTVDEHAWSATLRYEATGDGGETWWRKTRALDVEPSGATASLELELPRAVEEARALADATEVPSRLSFTVDVQHEASLTLDGEERSSQHTATVDLVPRNGFVVVDTQEDGSTYSQPVDGETDRKPLILLALVLLIEGGIRLYRREDPAWEHQRGVHAVKVDDLVLPPEAHRTSFGALARLARRQGQPLLVDETTGHALVEGPSPLWAKLPASGELATDDCATF